MNLSQHKEVLKFKEFVRDSLLYFNQSCIWCLPNHLPTKRVPVGGADGGQVRPLVIPIKESIDDRDGRALVRWA
jgi:hypothetical protein